MNTEAGVQRRQGKEKHIRGEPTLPSPSGTRHLKWRRKGEKAADRPPNCLGIYANEMPVVSGPQWWGIVRGLLLGSQELGGGFDPRQDPFPPQYFHEVEERRSSGAGGYGLPQGAEEVPWAQLQLGAQSPQ